METTLDAEQSKALTHLFGILRTLETEYGLPYGYIPKLLYEDDWSFVIKLHALVEAVVSDSLTSAVDRRIDAEFRRLNLIGRSGKVRFAESLGLIEKAQSTFIVKLSEIRNSAVHDIRKVDLSLRAYFEGLPAGEKSGLTDSIVALFDKSIMDRWRMDTVKDIKSAIWVGSMLVISSAKTNANIAKAKAELMKASLDTIQALQKQGAEDQS
jgi:hypothetical protein